MVILFPTSVCDTFDTSLEDAVAPSEIERDWLQAPAGATTAIDNTAAAQRHFERFPATILLHGLIVS
jgi:hypothetical protein